MAKLYLRGVFLFIIVLFFGVNSAFAQCGLPGTPPCPTKPKTTPKPSVSKPKPAPKPAPKPIVTKPKPTTPKPTAPTVSKPTTTTKKPTAVTKPKPQNRFVPRAPNIEMVKIPAGSFMMGSDKYDDEKPVHRVNIGYSFYMGKYEVNQAQWKAVMGNNPSNFKGDDLPVETVSWNEVQEFIRKLNNLQNDYEYRLPSEAEWEYAARGGKDGDDFGIGNGNSLSSEQANFDGNYPYGYAAKGKYLQRTVSVGSYQSNAFGLYDMHGNVWEWVQDIYKNNYSGLSVDGSVNVSVGDSGLRVLRGGSWYFNGNNCRSANRYWIAPAYRNNYYGFRLVFRPS